MLDMSQVHEKRDQYGRIIRSLLPHFRALYKKQEPNSKLPLATKINNGDCYVMATLVYVIAKAQGLSPTIHAGGWHVWVEENGFVFDAYFPDGINRKGIKALQVNDMGDDEPPFYQGSAIKSIENLQGYYFNGRDRAIFVEYLLKPYGESLPMGLRKYLQRRSKYRSWNRRRDAMKRFIIQLRNQNEKARLRLR